MLVDQLEDLCIDIWVSVMSQHPDNRETWYIQQMYKVIIVIGVPAVGGIGFSYAYDFARNEGNVSLSPVFEALQSFFSQDFSLTFQFSRIFNLFYPGFFSLFSFQGLFKPFFSRFFLLSSVFMVFINLFLQVFSSLIWRQL